MRIILLDRSGSMGDPFQGKTEFAGRTRKTEATIKLEAAKAELLRSLASLASPSRIAIFEFTSAASLIYEGISNDYAAIKRALAGLTAYDGTSIAAALDKASAYAAGLSNVPFLQVLVISDGLSHLALAQAAARRLARLRAVIINVILIDPTEDGKQVARAIAVNGEVIAVLSSEEFAESISEVTKGEEEFARKIDLALNEYREEEDALANKVLPEERLSFTVAYPGAISHGFWYSLLVYLHLARLQQDVAEIIRQRATQIGLESLTSSAEAIASVKQGTWLRLIPRVSGVVFNPSSQEVAWLEDIQESSFRLRADESVTGRPLPGTVDVYCGPALIAQIPLSINVRDPKVSPRGTTSATANAQIFKRIFASYSHKDESIIDACVAVYEALGIYVYIDKHALRSGQIWHAMLRQFIDKSDIFQLYWSKSSSQSEAVEDEWTYALSLFGRKGETFIRPLYWELDWPGPPAKLSHLHFARLDLAALALQTGQSNLTAQMPQPVPAGTSAPPLPVAVVPVLPGLSPEVQKAIREDTAYAVNFLEETTGLRYYPVPTLLVDEYAIKSVRSLHTTDWMPPSKQVDQALALSDLLGAIELTFYVSEWRPKSSEIELWDTLFGKGKLITAEQYDCLQRFCEGGLQATVRQSISPRWLQGRADMSGKVPGINQSQGFSSFILTALAYAIRTARPTHLTAGWVVRRIEGASELKLWQEAGIQIPSAHDRVSLRDTSFETLVSALGFCHQELSPGLSRYDDVDAAYSFASIPENEKFRALTAIVDMIADTVFPYDSPLRNLGAWLEDIVAPSWRAMRDVLANLQFRNFNAGTDYLWFISECLNTTLSMLQEGLTNLGDFPAACRYPVKKSSWEVVRKEFPELSLKLAIKGLPGRNEEEVISEGPYSAFVNLYAGAKARLIAILSQYARFKTPLERIFAVQVPTYGIYVPATAFSSNDRLKRWAFDRGVPTELTFPQSSRVLFCLLAQERFEKETERVLADRRIARQMACDFQRSVLIHEHFHAILETGLDEKRSPANGVKFDEAWREASPLNESLAAWMELHNARQNHDLMKLVWSYIQAGTYPQWPYRGAEKVETLFQEKGMSAVRDLIRSLRRDPESAQAAFDANT